MNNVQLKNKLENNELLAVSIPELLPEGIYTFTVTKSADIADTKEISKGDYAGRHLVILKGEMTNSDGKLVATKQVCVDTDVLSTVSPGAKYELTVSFYGEDKFDDQGKKIAYRSNRAKWVPMAANAANNKAAKPAKEMQTNG
jgi:ABC-type molybdate transport system substrate-binding protein